MIDNKTFMAIMTTMMMT